MSALCLYVCGLMVITPCKNWHPHAGGAICQNISDSFARHLPTPWPKIWFRPCFITKNMMRYIFFLFDHIYRFTLPSKFGPAVVQPDQDGEVSGLSLGHTKDFKNGTYCSSACAGHKVLELGECLGSYLVRCTSMERWYTSKNWLSDKL